MWCVIDFDGDDDETDDNKNFFLPPVVQRETYNDVNISENVTSDQRNGIQKLCESFANVLTDKPGVTNLVDHEIQLMRNEPVRIKQYPFPFHTEKTIKEEVDKMLQLKVIKSSSSPYCAPVVIARKKDGTNRFCVDLR